jgi:hypothetical protein
MPDPKNTDQDIEGRHPDELETDPEGGRQGVSREDIEGEMIGDDDLEDLEDLDDEDVVETEVEPDADRDRR